MASEAITTRQNQVSKSMDTTIPPTPLPVSPPPSSPSTPSLIPAPVPSSPCLPSFLPLLCLPHQLVHHHTTLGSAPATEGDLMTRTHPFTPATSTERAIFTTSLKIPPDMQAKIYVDMDPSKKSYASIAALDLNENISLPLNAHLHHLLLTEPGITDIQACKAALAEPDTLTYDQVLLCPDFEEWKKSTHKEITQLESKDTGVEVPTSEDRSSNFRRHFQDSSRHMGISSQESSHRNHH